MMRRQLRIQVTHRGEVPKYIYREFQRNEVQKERIKRESKRDEAPKYIYREF